MDDVFSDFNEVWVVTVDLFDMAVSKIYWEVLNWINSLPWSMVYLALDLCSFLIDCVNLIFTWLEMDTNFCLGSWLVFDDNTLHIAWCCGSWSSAHHFSVSLGKIIISYLNQKKILNFNKLLKNWTSIENLKPSAKINFVIERLLDYCHRLKFFLLNYELPSPD